MEKNNTLKKNRFYFPIYRWFVIREIAIYKNTLESNILKEYSEEYGDLIKEGIKHNISPKEVAKKIIKKIELL